MIQMLLVYVPLFSQDNELVVILLYKYNIYRKINDLVFDLVVGN